MPKNIYGVTKVAAESPCELFHRLHGLPCLVLRTSRFFPEEDDLGALRGQYANENLKANELLNRRVEIEDVVSAHLLALERAPAIGFARYVISATTPVISSMVRLGWLRKNGRRVRMTKTTIPAERTDSMNQPVWKVASLAFSSHSKTAKVAKSKSELIRPKTSIKRLIKRIFQRCGRFTKTSSTRSLAMVISGRSVRKLINRICLGSIGR